MSRIGRTPIKVPAGVTVQINDRDVHVKGKLGELNYTMQDGIVVVQEENLIKIERSDDSRPQKAFHGLTRALIQNMVTGVSEGYQKELHVIGTGYSAEVMKPWLKISIGYSHDILLEIPEGITVSAEPVARMRGSKSALQAIVKVNGINKEDVGKFAAEIRKCRKPENYKGKGIRYADEFVKIKIGKSGK